MAWFFLGGGKRILQNTNSLNDDEEARKLAEFYKAVESEDETKTDEELMESFNRIGVFQPPSFVPVRYLVTNNKLRE